MFFIGFHRILLFFWVAFHGLDVFLGLAVQGLHRSPAAWVFNRLDGCLDPG